MRPLIGITCNVSAGKRHRASLSLGLDSRYADSVSRAGGVPLMLPPPPSPEGRASREGGVRGTSAGIRRMLESIQGLLIPGGPDIDPKYYGERRKPGTEVILSRRFLFEKALYQLARDRGMPVLGICYGMQLINVVEGGSLHQDLARDAGTKMEHRELKRKKPHHEVAIIAESGLGKILGLRKSVVHTSHHQGVNRVAPGFRVVARSPDGVVESIEGPFKNVMAVQWHPERLLNSPASRSLFQALVRMAGARA